MWNLLPASLLAGLIICPAGAAEPIEWWAPQANPQSPAQDPAILVAEEGEGIRVGTGGPRLEVATEYIFWWLREGRLPPTLTTSSQASRGLLGAPDTHTLYGGDRLQTRHGDQFNGVRLTLAYWFDDCQTLGIEGQAFFLERDSTHFKAVSDGSTLLARPYFNPDGSPASEIIAGQAPTGLRNGGFVGYSRIELFGQEVNLVASLCVSDVFRLEALSGARFLQMRDRTDLTATGYALPKQSTMFGLDDHYRTENAYYGAQVGLRGELTRGRWSLLMRGEIGLGCNEEHVRAFGDRVIHTPTERLVALAGLTVQTSNAGTYDRTALNMVSEAGFNIGYRLTQHLQFFAGYTLLVWDNPLRSGDQIDLVVNPIPGTLPARPAIPFKEDLFWAQGINGGLVFSW
jgi:hypothetical protein